MDLIHTTPIIPVEYTSRELHRIKELKEQAINYYRDNKVPIRMEEIMNSMFYDDPKDVYGHLADYFASFAFPVVISKIMSEIVMNGLCHPILKVSLFYTKLKVNKLVGVSTMTALSLLSLDGATAEERNAYTITQLETLKEAIRLADDVFAPLLIGLQPRDQINVDKILIEHFLVEEELLFSDYFDELARQSDLTDQIIAAQNISNDLEVIDAAKDEANKKLQSTKSPKGAKTTKLAAVALIPDEARPPLQLGAVLKSAVSSAVAKAAASLSGLQLYTYLREIRVQRLEARIQEQTVEKMLDAYEGHPPASISDPDVPNPTPRSAESTAHEEIDVQDETVKADETDSRSNSPTSQAEEDNISTGDRYVIPQVMVTILAGGKLMPGKHNSVKEFMLIPRANMPTNKAIQSLNIIYDHCARSLSKVNISGRFLNDYGSLCPSFDRCEMGLDLIQEAVASIDCTLGEDFFVALNCASHEYYDYDKGRYEVIQGQLKSGDELADYWNDIVKRYPCIIMLIDPIRKVEKEAWSKLCSALSETCYIAADFNLPAVRHILAFKKQDVTCIKTRPYVPQTNCVCLRYEGSSTLSEFIDVVDLYNETKNEIILCTSIAENLDIFLIDLAVSLNIRFLRIGSLFGSDRIEKLNHLHSIEKHILAENGETIREIDSENEDNIYPVTVSKSRLKFNFNIIIPLISSPMNESKNGDAVSAINSSKKR